MAKCERYKACYYFLSHLAMIGMKITDFWVKIKTGCPQFGFCPIELLD
jgi:hypothetical protein